MTNQKRITHLKIEPNNKQLIKALCLIVIRRISMDKNLIRLYETLTHALNLFSIILSFYEIGLHLVQVQRTFNQDRLSCCSVAVTMYFNTENNSVRIVVSKNICASTVWTWFEFIFLASEGQESKRRSHIFLRSYFLGLMNFHRSERFFISSFNPEIQYLLRTISIWWKVSLLISNE